MTLTRDEAAQRAAIVTPTAYDVRLDLTAGDREFGSRTQIAFDAQVGAETFVDVAPVELLRTSLNGRPLPAEAFDGRRLRLSDLAEHNALVVEARMAYSHDGQGLHRALDPADGESYVYGHLFMDAAPRVFACFDQPDLKAPYDLTVVAPSGWRVLANGVCRVVDQGDVGRVEGSQTWRAETTKPLATYFVTLCAGPFASVEAEHDGIPLGVHARASLREHLEAQAPQMLEVTRQSFDYYDDLFGIRYPFGAYHQVFVPEFNAGAMENPGCVTFRDQLVFTGAASRTEHLNRANTISHEMAHMWFGDLVTLAWWNDLWLNESFAEYMANRTLVAATAFDEAWVGVAAGRKSWGYAAERSPSTHPVAGAPADDTDTALQNFDGIAYAKGSAVLRQLIHHIGGEAFIAGVRVYLRRHAFGNATLEDFIAALEQESGVDLTAWVEAWLTTAGMDTLRVEREPVVRLVVEPHAEFPAQRRHTLDVAAYTPEGSLLALDHLEGAEGEVQLPQITSALAEMGADDARRVVIVPNAGDLTWAGVEFDPHTLDGLAAALPGIEDATTRAMIWTALAHGLAVAAVSPHRVLDVVEQALPAETQMPVLDVAVGLAVVEVVGRFLPWADRVAARTRLASVGEAVMAAAVDDDDARLLAGARLVAATGDAGRLRAWFDGEDLPAGLDGDAPFRWRVARRLAQLDAVTIDDLDTALAADDTASGRLGYLTARASFPDADAKAWAWEELTAPPTPEAPAHSNYEMNALAGGFWSSDDESVLAPYIERYVRDIPAMRAWVGEDALARVAVIAFPSALASEQLDVEARRMLDGELPASVRRAVVDQQALVREVLESRVAFAPAE